MVILIRSVFMLIFVRSGFFEENKYYPQVFLDKSLFK